jgi:hypothetical protein
MVLHGRRVSAHITSIQRFQHTVDVAVEEKWDRVPILSPPVDYSVQTGLVASRGPHLQHIADIHDEGIGIGYNINPDTVSVVPDLETTGAVL